MVGNDPRYYMYYPRIQAICQAPFRVLSPLPAFRRQKKQTMYLAIKIGICYNADRQTKYLFPLEHENPQSGISGDFLFLIFKREGLDP